LTWKELASKLDLSQHTLMIDWQLERTTIPYNAGESLAKEYFPREWNKILNLWIEKILPAKWGQLKAGDKNKKSIKIPVKNEDLSEIFGVILGDGHLDRKTLTIAGNSNEIEHYFYLERKFDELFGLKSHIFKIKDQNSMQLRVNSTELIKFLIGNSFVLGNKIRNKESLPKWIFEKKEFAAGALRGMFDTDGGIYQKQKGYRRAIVEFQTESSHIRENLVELIKKIGLNPSKSDVNIRIQNQDEVLKFFQIVGSSNPKNIARYNIFIKTGEIPLKEKLIKDIKDIKIEKPFKAALI